VLISWAEFEAHVRARDRGQWMVHNPAGLRDLTSPVYVDVRLGVLFGQRHVEIRSNTLFQKRTTKTDPCMDVALQELRAVARFVGVVSNDGACAYAIRDDARFVDNLGHRYLQYDVGAYPGTTIVDTPRAVLLEHMALVTIQALRSAFFRRRDGDHHLLARVIGFFWPTGLYWTWVWKRA
jgi:hypothetical protein